MTVYFIDGGPLLPSLEHLVEYYCIESDGLVTTLQYAVSPSMNCSIDYCSEPALCRGVP